MRRVAFAIDMTAGVLLGAVALLTFLEAVLRHLFTYHLPDAYSLAGHAQGIAIMWGIASATYAGRHITVDLVHDALPPGGRRRLELAATLISAGFLAAAAWMAWQKVERSSRSWETTSDLRLSVWIFVAVAAAGLSVAVVMALLRLRRLWRGEATGPEDMPCP